MHTIAFFLDPKTPFRLDLTVWALRRLPHNAVDRWDGRIYSRTLVIDGQAVRMDITQPGGRRIRVEARTAGTAGSQPKLTRAIEKLLGIRIALGEFYRFAAGRKAIAPLVSAYAGLKPPRFPSVFEALINAVACQQLSLHVGIELLNRLAVRFGRTLQKGNYPAFPLPEDLAGAAPAVLRRLGFSTSKAESIIALARMSAGKGLDLERLATADDADALGQLLGLRGIGRWSAEYALLRGLGRLHVFPGDDVGAGNTLQKLFDLPKRPDYETIRKLTLAWHPYEGLLYFHFLLNRLKSRGYLERQSTPAA